MADKVTATLTITNGTVTLLNKSDRTFMDVPFKVFSDVTDEKFSQIAERSFRNDSSKVFIDSKVTGRTDSKYSMWTWEFVSIAHPVAEKESKVDLITRTISAMEVTAYVTRPTTDGSCPWVSEDTFYLDFISDDSKLQKELQKEAVKKNCIFIQTKEVRTASTLYGVTKEQFIQKARREEQ